MHLRLSRLIIACVNFLRCPCYYPKIILGYTVGTSFQVQLNQDIVPNRGSSHVVRPESQWSAHPWAAPYREISFFFHRFIVTVFFASQSQQCINCALRWALGGRSTASQYGAALLERLGYRRGILLINSLRSRRNLYCKHAKIWCPPAIALLLSPPAAPLNIHSISIFLLLKELKYTKSSRKSHETLLIPFTESEISGIYLSDCICQLFES